LWFPRVWPLRATYNDYGSVEKVEDGATRQAWMDAFKIDLIERGWGDNSVHDINTSKDMTFDEMLAAVYERRVIVRSHTALSALRGHGKDSFLAKAEKASNARVFDGVPTRDGVEKLLASHGFTVFRGGHKKSDMIVDDDEGYGRIRVRAGDFNGAKQLLKAEKIAKDAGYAAMVTHGSGAYSGMDGELLIRPNPDVKGYHFPLINDDDKKPLPVEQAMVREDVWQQLCKITFKESYGRETYSVDRFIAGARAAWEVAMPKDLKETNRWGDDLSMMELERDAYANAFAGNDVPFTVGLGVAFRLVAKRAKSMSKKAIDMFITGAGEFAFLRVLMSMNRYMFAPSYSSGPQYGEWRVQAQVLKAITEVATEKAAEEIEDDE
jgi:hypothetical protein